MLRRLLGSLLLASTVQTASAQELVTHVFGANLFTIQLPKEWTLDPKQKHFSASSPDGRVALTATAYSKKDGSLIDFSSYRFTSVHEWYKPVNSIKKFKAGAVNGVYWEFEGIWPGEPTPTYYVVACIDLGNAYASVTFTTDRSDFAANRIRYVQILLSVQPGS